MTFAEWIAGAHPYLALFDYDHYPENFAAFEQGLAAWTAVWEQEELAQAVEAVLAQFEERWRGLGRRERREAALKDKQVLALFFSPAAARRTDAAGIFAQELCRAWNRRYPRNPYALGMYETILSGFDANLLGLPLRKSSRR